MTDGALTRQVISRFSPQWKNKHTPDCEVTKQRESLWESFVNNPTDGALHGAVIEYDGGGDQERENCTCGKYPPQVLQQATYLSEQARALAVHIEAFNKLVARDEDTHDGAERGTDWAEPISPNLYEGPTGKSEKVGGRDLERWTRLLFDLADTWDFG